MIPRQLQWYAKSFPMENVNQKSKLPKYIFSSSFLDWSLQPASSVKNKLLDLNCLCHFSNYSVSPPVRLCDLGLAPLIGTHRGIYAFLVKLTLFSFFLGLSQLVMNVQDSFQPSVILMPLRMQLRKLWKFLRVSAFCFVLI